MRSKLSILKKHTRYHDLQQALHIGDISYININVLEKYTHILRIFLLKFSIPNVLKLEFIQSSNLE